VLDRDERVVVILHYWADLTLAVVAERTGWPLGTVKSRLHRALVKLGGSLDGDSSAGAGGAVVSDDLERRVRDPLRSTPLPAAPDALRATLLEIAADTSVAHKRDDG
jgi:hypothetical protein